MIRRIFAILFVTPFLVLLLTTGCTENRQSQNPNEEIAGTWISDKTTAKIRISFDGGSIKVDCWNTEDNEQFRTSDIQWDGNELQVTFFLPSTDYTSHWTFTQVSSDILESSFQGIYSGTETWTRE